jgi:hypothetical protein
MKGRPLGQIVDDLDRLWQESVTWFQDNVQLRLEACQTIEEVMGLHGEIAYQARDADNQIREIPFPISLPLMCARVKLQYGDEIGQPTPQGQS